MHGSLPPTTRRSRRRSVAAILAISAASVVAVVVGQGFLDRQTGGVAEVVLTTDAFTFSDRRIEVHTETVELTMANVDAVTHTFTVPGLGVELVVGAGEARSLTFDAPEGRYTFLCAVPGHDSPGMRGELAVR